MDDGNPLCCRPNADRSAPRTALAETLATVTAMTQTLTGAEGIKSVTFVVGRSAPALYNNMVGNRTRAPGYVQALVTTDSPADTARLPGDLQRWLTPAFPGAEIPNRGLVQGPPFDAPIERRLVGDNLTEVRAAGDDLRAQLAKLPQIMLARARVSGGRPKLTLHVDEPTARLLGLDLGQIAHQMEAGLEGATSRSIL